MAFYTIERRVSRRTPFGYGLGVSTVMPVSPAPSLVDAGDVMRNLVRKVDAPLPVDRTGMPIIVPGVTAVPGSSPSPSELPPATPELLRRCSWLCPAAGVAGFFLGALLLRVLRG